MTSVFDAYVEEARETLQSLESVLTEASSAPESRLDALVQNAELYYSQISDVLQQMTFELRSVPKTNRAALKMKADDIKKEAEQARRRLDKLQEDHSRRKLLGGSTGEIGAKTVQDRQRLHDANEQFTLQNQRLEDARRSIADTEDTGLDIMNQLAQNREKISTAHARVKEENSMLEQANGMVTRMSKWWNRW